MKLRYSPLNEIELEGTLEELRTLSRGLSKSLRGANPTLMQETEYDFDPKPYPTALRCLMIECTAGRVCVSVRNDVELYVAGSEEALRGFASWLEVPDDIADGYHIHFEYYDNHPVIAPASVPLVISVRS